MDEEHSQPLSGQEIDETEEGSPVPDPEEGEGGDADDVPTAD
ncbi:MAG TPA: hypothetical protein VFR63_02655 [Gaiellaceae bacterium]|jgi:hypothetical protein|nr:hypothetical protein [Gaiellaceae bacterium]